MGDAGCLVTLGNLFPALNRLVETRDDVLQATGEGGHADVAKLGNAIQRAVAQQVVEQLAVGEGHLFWIGHSQADEAPQQLREVTGVCKIVFLISVYRGGGKTLIFRLLHFWLLSLAISFVGFYAAKIRNNPESAKYLRSKKSWQASCSRGSPPCLPAASAQGAGKKSLSVVLGTPAMKLAAKILQSCNLASCMRVCFGARRADRLVLLIMYII